MIRFGGVLWFIMMGVWIYALLDVITTDSSLVRNLSKVTWVFIVLITSIIGAVLWFVAGRPAKAGFKPGDTSYRKPIAFRAPDDDPEFLSGIRHAAPPVEPVRPVSPPTPGSGQDGPPPASRDLQAWEADLQRREEELRRRGDGDDPPAPG